MKKSLELTESNLKEIFELFCSNTKYELEEIYNSQGEKSFFKTNLEDEYEVSLPIKDFSIDAWKSVLYFLCKQGYRLEKEGEVIDLSFIEDEYS